MHGKGGSPVAFVEYHDVRFAAQAMSTLQGSFLLSSDRGAIRIEYAKSKMAEVGLLLKLAPWIHDAVRSPPRDPEYVRVVACCPAAVRVSALAVRLALVLESRTLKCISRTLGYFSSGFLVSQVVFPNGRCHSFNSDACVYCSCILRMPYVQATFASCTESLLPDKIV
ncbi:hypothetical protein PR048_003897 [Dryococelus australis]|uniref:RRM domain-containing protein n=1 Tax=Dryococelus australis TaxID=614101 RepID=A0ABQ9IPR7_9NEOP|nr:hypothetical protein PR048_003897 [Dryococelus australis]